MSDSLRDQLLQAGFKQSAKEPAKSAKRKNTQSRKTTGASGKGKQPVRSNAQLTKEKEQAEADAAAQRKATKAKIKTLIEDAEIKDFAGEEVYRFTLQNRIRELHLKPDIRSQVVAGTLSVTRLNGTTRLVPTAIIDEIQAINPNWAIVKPASDSSDSDGDYDDYQVPDDLVW